MKHNWGQKYLGDLCQMKSGSFISADELDDSFEYPCFGGNGIRGRIQKYSHDGDYIIIGRVGALCGNVNQFNGKFYATEHAIVASPITLYVSRWLYYVLRNANLRRYAKGAALPVISVGTLKNIEIAVPPLETQIHIALELDKINEIIADCRKLHCNLDSLAQSLFFDYFSGIHEYVPLSHYVNALVGGKSLASKEVCENRVLKSGAVTYDYFDKHSTKYLPNDYTPNSDHMVKIGDLIISRMNTAELVGACAYVFDVDDNVYLPDRLWRIEHKSNSNPIFLWKSLIDESAKEQIRAKASGTSGSMKNISKPLLLSVKIKNVPLSLQKSFAERIEAIERQKATVEETIKKMQTLLDSRMDYWFN